MLSSQFVEISFTFQQKFLGEKIFTIKDTAWCLSQQMKLLTICIITTLFLGCFASDPILYGLLLNYQQNEMVYTANVIGIDVLNGTISNVMEFNTTF